MINDAQSADESLAEVIKHRSDFENASWSSAYTDRAIMYAGRKGMASASELTLFTHYAPLFRKEYIRLQEFDQREREADKDENLSETERALYAISDAKAADEVRKIGLPVTMSKNDAMVEIMSGFVDIVEKKQSNYRPMSDEDRADIYAELDATSYKTTTYTQPDS